MTTKTTYTMEDLTNKINQMKVADVPEAKCDATTYATYIALAITDMPKMSGKQIGLLMECLHAAYQLGRVHHREGK
jgi:hypothetical protein